MGLRFECQLLGNPSLLWCLRLHAWRFGNPVDLPDPSAFVNQILFRRHIPEIGCQPDA